MLCARPVAPEIVAFLRFTVCDPHRRPGVLLPDNRTSAFRNAAENGVAAGYRPEYIPILVEIAEGLRDPPTTGLSTAATPRIGIADRAGLAAAEREEGFVASDKTLTIGCCTGGDVMISLTGDTAGTIIPCLASSSWSCGSWC